jgi:choline-sulfatase
LADGTDAASPPLRTPNIVLVITDQQRYPRHWPDEAGWFEQLMPADAELRRTGITFTRAFCNTAMCSPSRATLLTGRYPAEHGVELTLTASDLQPDPRNAPDVARTMIDILRSREAPPRRILTQFAKGALRLGQHPGKEATLPPAMANMATLLRAGGYTVAYKGKWHLSHPAGDGPLLAGWAPADAAKLEALGFEGWEPPDAGENAKAEHFGGGNAADGEGFDELYTQQAERWLAQAKLPEPFCLIVSLVNPHDVLGYPASYERGGYQRSEFADLGVGLPPTVDEHLQNKPAVHALMRMGMTAYMGKLVDRQAQLDYVNFYAHLHRVVDEKIARVLASLGDAGDPGSLRSRTVVVRCSDHGEMGLSHGGLRQKMFNVYEETINVPLVFSNPVMFPDARETDAFASLVDVLPTLLALAGGSSDGGLRGRDLSPVLSGAVAGVQDQVHFTYDDHQAGTATQNAPGQPNRIRAVRTDAAKYAVYYDPDGEAAPEYELYDLERDPLEVDNLVDVRTGQPRTPAAKALQAELGERLMSSLERSRTAPRMLRQPAWIP